MNTKIRIKDIAERAGVSVGTVDRVLHDRPNVSEVALKKVKTALEEMEYRPNLLASALANTHQYNFYLLMPKQESESYWSEIEEGTRRCLERRRDYNLQLQSLSYNRFVKKSFMSACKQCLDANPDGVILVPSTLEATQSFTDKLHDMEIPFILLDSYMPDLKPLAFYGQDSFASGYFAARILGLVAYKETELMIMKQTKDGRVASKQQDNREVGFRHYMHDHFPKINILELDLPLDDDHEKYDSMLEDFFHAHPKLHHCITFSSKAHIVGEFLLRTNRRSTQIMGYDMVDKNVECIRQGSISFLIAQHAYMQGYYCVEALVRAIVLKQEINPVNYMPIELLTRENVDFYQRTMI